ncbi:N-acetylmuramoyl-L-alanine amidase [Spiractinospora alimapuensis]|uniref:N-acetylmuramoyl-L-alanine amidase n=1 Tax=Spiractinospora alimapuensis TaxID=2820884 RepID=UPI001F2C354E|nr:N-acetylmuramoyl-L-alanine amidase [Spiractinospora alimapuensis]
MPAIVLALLLAGCANTSEDPPSPSTGDQPDTVDADGEQDPRGDGTDEPEEPTDPPGPLDGFTVVIDPGHNGANHTAPDVINEQIDAGGLMKNCDTVGASTDDGYAEHEFNFDLATELRDLLEADGAEVVLTREDNDGVGPCLPDRAGAANDIDADAAISLHADGGPPSGRGFHIIAPAEVSGHTEDIVEPSRDLGESVRDSYAEAADMAISDYISTEDGIHVRDDLGGLNLSTVPKVFLEAGNMRNAEDAALLSDPDWREDAAAGVAEGIAAFLE